MALEKGKYYYTKIGEYDAYFLYILDDEVHIGGKVFDYAASDMGRTSFSVSKLDSDDLKRKWLPVTEAKRKLQFHRRAERYFCNSLLLVAEKEAQPNDSYAMKYLHLMPPMVQKNVLIMFFEES